MDYIIPDSIEDISRKVRGRSAYYIAGGTDIMALKKEDQLDENRIWVDISGLEELKGIENDGNYIKIGPLTTMTDIINNEELDSSVDALKEAADDMGSPLIRNLATVGGNLANSSPAGDTIPALCALDAVIIAGTAGSKREIPAREFVTGPGENVLEDGQVITSVNIPYYPGSSSGFLKLGSRKALAISKVSVAAWWVIEDKKIKDISIYMGAVGPRPVRAKRTEDLLRGESMPGKSSEKMKEAKERIMTEATPIDDFRSTADYCSRMVGVLLQRILTQKQ